jgi:hypothetical protein
LFTLLTVFHHRLVITMSIGALRIYRGLVDSAALNTGSSWTVVSAEGLSTKEETFMRPSGFQEQDGEGHAAHDPNYSNANHQQILVKKRQKIESFGSKRV